MSLGTNPFSCDSDGDGITDIDELELETDPNNPDSDGDGFLDADELAFGLNPLVADPNNPDDDTDNDGIPNAVEMFYVLNPLNSSDAQGDLDNDGLANLEEYQMGTRIDDADTDNDGILDGYDTDPFHAPNESLDSDNDGLPDSWELKYGLNPLDASDSSIDSDMDGLTNLEEYTIGLNPKNPDTDYDKLNDGWEYRNMNPASILNAQVSGVQVTSVIFNPKYWNNSNLDSDSDGLNDFNESIYDTNPRLSDTDSDGTGDVDELLGGRNPKDASDINNPLDYNSMVEVELSGECICNSLWHRCSWMFTFADRTLLTSSVYDPTYTYHIADSLTVYVKKGAIYNGSLNFISGSTNEGLPWDCSTLIWSVRVKSLSDGIGLLPSDENSLDNPLSYLRCDGEFCFNYQTLDTPSGEYNRDFSLTIFDYKFITPKSLEADELITKDTMIISGTGKNAYVFDSSAKGEFVMDLKLEVFPKNHGLSDQQMNKLIDRLIIDAKLHTDTARYLDSPLTYSEGLIQAKLRCVGLPENNDDFGNKKIILKNGYKDLASTTFQTFYSLRAANNPQAKDGVRPVNLVFYYSQGLGIDDSDMHIYHSDANGITSKFNIQGIGDTTGLGDKFWFVVGTLPENSMTVVGSGTSNGGKTLKYMQLFKYAYMHERKHVDFLNLWWDRPSCYNAELGLYTSQNKECKDYDTDKIPDIYEYIRDPKRYDWWSDPREPLSYLKDRNGNDLTCYDVYGSGVGGLDDFNHLVEVNIIGLDENPGTEDKAIKNDWACPGAQYKQD